MSMATHEKNPPSGGKQRVVGRTELPFTLEEYDVTEWDHGFFPMTHPPEVAMWVVCGGSRLGFVSGRTIAGTRVWIPRMNWSSLTDGTRPQTYATAAGAALPMVEEAIRAAHAAAFCPPASDELWDDDDVDDIWGGQERNDTIAALRAARDELAAARSALDDAEMQLEEAESEEANARERMREAKEELDAAIADAVRLGINPDTMETGKRS